MGERPAWEKVSRLGVNFASAASAVGFTAATKGTKLGFTIARSITSTVASTSTSVAEHVVFGGPTGAAPLVHATVSGAFDFAESLFLIPIQLGQSITSAGLVAASSSIDQLTQLFGSNEASFSLREFVQLVRREWNNPASKDQLPEKTYKAVEIGRSIAAWAAIQCVTQSWAQKRWMLAMTEIDIEEWRGSGPRDASTSPNEPLPDVHITSDIILPDEGGEILTADIGYPDIPGAFPHTPSPSVTPQRVSSPISEKSAASIPVSTSASIPSKPNYGELRLNMRRLSKMVIGGYGGASLVFFGIPFPSVVNNDESKTNTVEGIVNAAERDASDVRKQQTPSSMRSWWSLIAGKHDQEIFEGFAFSPSDGASAQGGQVNIATVGNVEKLPRFWVLKDHGRRQIVLVLRGTFSLNELAIDLTCDPEPFHPMSSEPINATGKQPNHQVHGGMLRIAQLMGKPGAPVHIAILRALSENPGYDLVLTGHSLGAGVAAMLALMWADPVTALTVRISGLPPNRRVSAYCFAPPCLTTPALSKMSTNLITSFVYSNDLVSRLSLGSIRDLQRAAAWLCHLGDEDAVGAEAQSTLSIIARAVRFGSGVGWSESNREEEKARFLSLRKTLEANMHMTDGGLFPTGRVLWALRQADLPFDLNQPTKPEQLRIFQVDDVERAFSQIEFSRDMLSSHLPHNYDRVIEEASTM